MEPVRTCIGCRSRAPRSSLLRVVVQESVIVVDESATLPGRGAWLHPSPECVKKALQRKAFGRALRVSGAIETVSIAHQLENRLNG
ncbi:YlxR family protein [Gryllotalpicola protaetiae]|uniref:YlxR family protein n=1 Tax=Gryllotalpicola protaetiae TaxID=2419771 RepID=A0A387BU52_9MICO|nr:YlxR family protein [Gryllotalpicola protaetiae]AYG04467.1 YlxR family protein [Gryllotalpicola protaetiae]